MGVYIKGMEMPKEAGKYRIEFDQCGNPYLLSDNGDGGIWHIIPVPPHGRLIDADDFERNNQYFWNRDFINPKYEDTLADLVNAAPTVIPASEEGE